MLKALLSFIGVEIINWYGGGKTLTFPIFGWLIAFGHLGNPAKLLRFDWISNKCWKGLHIEFISPGWLTTDIYVGLGKYARLDWNSEWVAKRFGEWTSEEEEEITGVSFSQYNGILGSHMYC